MKEELYQFKVLIKKISPRFLIGLYHFLIGFLAGLVYGFPSRKLKVIGITGTNGKSTVVEMITVILEEAGFKTASLSSIRFRLAGKDQPNTLRMTMPGRFFVQKFLRDSVKQKCQYAVVEVTSEGIKQHRHRFINFSAAVFTNLTPEHIESHGSFEKYRRAKGEFFRGVKGIHVLNLDDENFAYFNQFQAQKKINYSLADKNIAVGPDDSEFTVDGLRFKLNLRGEFNVYNALAAIYLAQSQDIGLEICRQALEKIKGLPGRMELVIKEPFKVFVDYAFTPNALTKVYQTIQNTRYKIPASAEAMAGRQDTKAICVLGSCGGGRDRWKRPVLGGIAAQYCDQIILTNEDPYDENPVQIVEDIKKGISSFAKASEDGQNTKVIIDRREAINKALASAQPGDVVIITGKGCEPSICLANGRQIPWDDRQVVREEFQKLFQDIRVKN